MDGGRSSPHPLHLVSMSQCWVLELGWRFWKLSEDFEQRQLIQWARSRPELQYLFHIPNESASGKGWGIRNRQLGVKSGVPDLMLPIPSRGYHGLFIEMKAAGGKVSENQGRWLEALETFGYRAVVCYGWEAARDEIEAYLATNK